MKNTIFSFALLCGLAVTGRAQKVDIIMATLAPAGSPWCQVLDKIADDWKKISGGNVHLIIRPGGQVGDEPESVKRLRIKSIQAVALSGAGMDGIEKGVSALQIPMMIDSYEELDYVRDRIAPKLEKRIEASGFIVLNWGDAGWVQFFSTKPINRLDDLRKLKLFTWAGDADEVDLWKTNGFKAVPLAATDIGQGLMTGMIDAVPMPALYAETGHVFETAKFMCDVKWAPLVGATLVAKETWEKIPADQRARMLKSAQDSGQALRNGIRGMGDRAITTMEAGQPGKKASTKLTVTHLDAAALGDWRKQTEAMYPKLKGKMIPADLFDEVQKLRDEYRAKGGKK